GCDVVLCANIPRSSPSYVPSRRGPRKRRQRQQAVDADDPRGADVPRWTVSKWPLRRCAAVVLFALAATAAVLAVVPFAAAREGARVSERPPQVHIVTLLTGDVVELLDRGSGRPTITLEPGADGRIPRATISLVGGHAYVVPESAAKLVAAHKLDLDLF